MSKWFIYFRYVIQSVLVYLPEWTFLKSRRHFRLFSDMGCIWKCHYSENCWCLCSYQVTGSWLFNSCPITIQSTQTSSCSVQRFSTWTGSVKRKMASSCGQALVKTSVSLTGSSDVHVERILLSNHPLDIYQRKVRYPLIYMFIDIKP